MCTGLWSPSACYKTVFPWSPLLFFFVCPFPSLSSLEQFQEEFEDISKEDQVCTCVCDILCSVHVHVHVHVHV